MFFFSNILIHKYEPLINYKRNHAFRDLLFRRLKYKDEIEQLKYFSEFLNKIFKIMYTLVTFFINSFKHKEIYNEFSHSMFWYTRKLLF